MRASFVIVNYNRKDELLFTIRKTKELIKDVTQDFEIVIVDNASLDGSAEAVKLNFPEILLIENPVNTGAPAWNLGFEKAQGDYFIILDDDSHIESGLEEGLAYMDVNPDVGILALNVFGGPYTKEYWKWKDGDETIGFIGCGAIFRRETYKKVGGYAEWMFLYVNEWELGLRCLDAGYKVKFFENSKVIHRASAINRSSKRFTLFVIQHEMGIVYKFFPYKRWRYLFRISVNNLKIIRHGNLKILWYTLIAIYKFFSFRKNLVYTPVSIKSQQAFVKIFPTIQKPVFGFISRRLSNTIKAR